MSEGGGSVTSRDPRIQPLGHPRGYLGARKLLLPLAQSIWDGHRPSRKRALRALIHAPVSRLRCFVRIYWITLITHHQYRG